MKELIVQRIQASIEVKQRLLENHQIIEQMYEVAEQAIQCLKNGGKVLFAGNGGSAADAQHLAAELSGRFYVDREPLYAEALHVNTSYLTAVANDYSYDEIYSRLVRAQGQPGDLLIGLSTSGNSKNVIKALECANQKDMITVALTGQTGGQMKDLCQYCFAVPSTDTPRIQECHILIGHTICELIEKGMLD